MDGSEIPSALDHIKMLSRINRVNRTASEKILQAHADDLRILGTALNAIYQAATCHRKCWNTGHVLEMMGARIYNLACAAYSLISIGFYDEALNLTRSIGEIANLISLSTTDKVRFREWLESSKTDRIKRFSPARVRELLSKGGMVLMDAKWYGELCEDYTHITPKAAPNFHEELKRSIAGGIVQEAGIERALKQLTPIVGMVALLYCRYFQFDDLFGELTKWAEKSNRAKASGVEDPSKSQTQA
jgi:hypothetical protein